MPFSTLGAKVCEKLQDDYVNYFGENSPEFKTGGDTGVIKYLFSPQNTTGFKKIKIDEPIAGKPRSIRMAMEQPMCFNVTAPSNILCTTTRGTLSDPSKIIDFAMDTAPFRVTDTNGVPLKFTLTEAEMNAYCTETDQSIVTKKVIKYLRRFEEGLDKAVATILSTRAGTNAAGQALTSLPFFVTNTATGTSTVNSDSMWYLKQIYKKIGGTKQYALLGGMVLDKINTILGWTGLNEAGIDLSKLADMKPYSYYDENLDTVLGADDFMMLAPGTAQLVTYNDYVGDRRKSITDLYSNITVVSPVTGLAMDMQYRYDYNCGIHTWEAYLHAEVATNVAGGCGNLATTNGIIRISDCSNGSTPPVCA